MIPNSHSAKAETKISATKASIIPLPARRESLHCPSDGDDAYLPNLKAVGTGGALSREKGAREDSPEAPPWLMATSEPS